MRGRSIVTIAFVLLAGLVAPAEAQQGPAANTLVVGQPTDADSVDPHKVTAVIAVERIYNLYDTLVNIDFNLETITPGLAEYYPWACPLKTETRVRIPLGPPNFLSQS